ncbi:MAG: nitroreductase family protein, partial [Phycisphaerales bacterium]|nr:nitroreductase family protein [Phycisphaerales bacterium]
MSDEAPINQKPTPPPRTPLRAYIPEGTTLQAAEHFETVLKQRRTVRHFSDRPVPRAVIESVIRSAGSAPSGANIQPWRFVAVSN